MFNLKKDTATIQLSSTYKTFDFTTRNFDLESKLALCKVGEFGIVVQIFDKATQSITNEQIQPSNSPCKIIETIHDQIDSTIYFIYAKKNKKLKGSNDLYFLCFNLRNEKFASQEKLITSTKPFSTFTTKTQYTTTGSIQNPFVNILANQGIIANYNIENNSIRILYSYLGYNYQYKLIQTTFSIDDLSISDEIEINSSFEEDLFVFGLFKLNNITAFCSKNKYEQLILSIIPDNQSTEGTYNIKLSDYFNSKDRLSIIEGENGTFSISSPIELEDKEHFIKTVFFSETGEFIKEMRFFHQEFKNNTNDFINLFITNIFINNEGGYDYYLYNKKEPSLQIVSVLNNTITNNKVLQLSDHIDTTTYSQRSYTDNNIFLINNQLKDRINIVANNGKIYVFTLTNYKGLKQVVLFVLNTETDNAVKHHLLTDLKLNEIPLYQFHLYRIIPGNFDETFYIEVYLGKKKNGIIKVKIQ